MRCPSCESQGVRMRFEAYVCNCCGKAYPFNHLTAWNDGYEAGRCSLDEPPMLDKER